jgi:hypothetical protein
MRPQIKLAGMMVLVLAVALGMSAVRSPTSALAAVEFTWTLLLLLGGILGVVYRRGERRPFWVGFVLFGWGYALLAFGPWFHMEVQPHLATTRALAELYPRVHSKPIPAQARQIIRDMDLYSYAYRQYDREVMWDRNLVNFLRIGHSTAAQALALLGGLLARRFYATRNPSDLEGEPTDDPRHV